MRKRSFVAPEAFRAIGEIISIFVTGASGWVGSAVTKELISRGHSVLGMVRSDEGAAKIAALGAEVYRGNLEEPESLRRGAVETEGTIHTAFSHDFSKFAQNGEDERKAIAVLGDALAGSEKPLIVTSGTGLLTPGKLVTEDTAAEQGPNHVPRDPERAAFAAVPHGVRAAVVRLPPSVHGEGDKGFIAMLTAIARQKGFAAYVGDGQNHWPAVHRFDAAKVFAGAVEKAAQGGARYHAIAEGGVPFRDIAESLGRGLGLPAKSIAEDEAADYFGWFARFAAINNLASADKTKAALGWAPVQQGLIADIDAGYYFS